MPQISRPRSLGDVEKPDLTLVRFEVPLPDSRREIISAFESILNQGGIQKVTVEIGRPIQVAKLVPADGSEPPIEAPSHDLWSQVHNGRMEELESPGATGYETLFIAFSSLTIRKLKPKAIFCHSFSHIRRWLKLDDIFPVDFLYGLEAVALPDIPEDAIIIVGTGFDESDPANTIGIRVPVDVPIATNVTPFRGHNV